MTGRPGHLTIGGGDRYPGPWVKASPAAVWFMALWASAPVEAREQQVPRPAQAPEGSAEPTTKGESMQEEKVAGPTPGAPTISLSLSIATALERNVGLLGASDSLQAARLRETVSRAQFHPLFTPRYQRASDNSTLAVDASQRVPWSGGSVSASATFYSSETTFTGTLVPYRSSDLRLIFTQPLLRGFGPTAASFDLTNSRRAREAQERALALARQRLAVDVTSAFFQVVKQRQLLEVARQSLTRSGNLKDASEARMKVGLASKLDVYRAELRASQAQEAMVSSQAGLETALELFRLMLGLDATDPVEPEVVVLPEKADLDVEPTPVLVDRALANRLDMQETRDQLKDGERSFALARQNLLPQLDVNLGFARTGFGPTFAESLRSGDQRLNVFLSTSYPLERSADAANKAMAELDLEGRRRALRQKQRDIEAEVRAAIRTLVQIRKSVELQSKAVELAAQEQQLATLRYQRGLASNFDVVEAEGSLVLARTALVGLLTDFEVARVQLLRVLGTLDVEKEFAS